MSRSVEHATFTIEREVGVPPSVVFAAFSDPGAKARWFSPPPEWSKSDHELDFRTGGTERLSVETPDGTVHRFDARYSDIVDEKRIVYCYDMYVGEVRVSVSVATIEFAATKSGTLVRFTEQGAFLDSADSASAREQGSQALLDNLVAELANSATSS